MLRESVRLPANVRLVARGLPALLYIRAAGRTYALAAGFMQATSLTLILVATVIGVRTSHQRTSTATALVVAGLEPP